MTSRTLTQRHEDSELRALRVANNTVRQMLAAGQSVDIKISRHVKRRTPPQHRTVWMWDGEFAAQLTALGTLTGSNVKWSKDDCHEMLFKRLCMAQIERVTPDGEIISRPMGLSDVEATVEIVSDAMERYQELAIRYGVELTQSEEVF